MSEQGGIRMEWPKITKDITFEELQDIHKKIWDYVAEHGGKPHTPYYHDCVLCEFTDILCHQLCEFCPALWGTERCTSGSTVYIKYIASVTLGDIDRIPINAKKVRDVPFSRERFDILKKKVEEKENESVSM